MNQHDENYQDVTAALSCVEEAQPLDIEKAKQDEKYFRGLGYKHAARVIGECIAEVERLRSRSSAPPPAIQAVAERDEEIAELKSAAESARNRHAVCLAPLAPPMCSCCGDSMQRVAWRCGPCGTYRESDVEGAPLAPQEDGPSDFDALLDHHRATECWNESLRAELAALKGSAPLDLLARINRIVQFIAELPNRTSPDDWPEAMLVTGDELRGVIAAEFSQGSAPLAQTRELLDVLTDAAEIRSACGFMWMRMAVAESAQDAYDVGKREFEDHKASFERLETSLPKMISALSRAANAGEKP